MKDKKILAMFITSAVALVASVVVTLGVALTLADPVPVDFATRCEFNFGSVNTNDNILQDGNVLIYDDAFVYSPTAAIAVNNWDVNSDDCDAPVYPLKNQDYGVELQVEESDASKIKVAYVKVNNDTGASIDVKVTAVYDKDSELGHYTDTVVFDYATNLFNTDADTVYAVPANGEAVFAVILYTDITDKRDETELVFGEVQEVVDIVVERI